MQSLPFPGGSFDLVVHSDTLEHVPDSTLGLQECLRVLRPGGLLAYTVPIVVGRLTRTRTGLPASFHGTAEGPEYLVVTEYGADAWVELARCGVEALTIVPLAHPAAHAITARKPRRARGAP